MSMQCMSVCSDTFRKLLPQPDKLRGQFDGQRIASTDGLAVSDDELSVAHPPGALLRLLPADVGPVPVGHHGVDLGH